MDAQRPVRLAGGHDGAEVVVLAPPLAVSGQLNAGADAAVLRLLQGELLVVHLVHGVVHRGGGDDRAALLVPQQAQRAAGGVAARHVVEVVGGDVGAPGAGGEPPGVHLGIMPHALEGVRGQGHALEVVQALVQHAGQHLGVAEGVMRAGALTVAEVIPAAEEQAVVGAGLVEPQVAQGGLGEHRVLPAQAEEHLLTAVRCAATPVGPLEGAGAHAVVPGAVGQHPFHMGAIALLEGVQRFVVAQLHGGAAQGGQGLLHVVAAHVDGGAALGGAAVDGLALAEEQHVLRQVMEAVIQEAVGQLGVVRPVEILAQQRHGAGVGGEVVDVCGHAHHQAGVQPVAHGLKAGLPGGSGPAVQQVAVVQQRVVQRHRIEHRDAVPDGLAVVVDAAVVAEHVLAPPEQLLRRGEVFVVSGSVGHAHHGIDGVVAAAVDHLAGGAEKSAVKVAVARHVDLQPDQRVAPFPQKGKNLALDPRLLDSHNSTLPMFIDRPSGRPVTRGRTDGFR